MEGFQIVSIRRIEPVRAYLLGLLPEQQAAELEERYFRDRNFFQEVKATERKLIEEYLDGRLAQEARQPFEERYQRVPELMRCVEEVRANRKTQTGWWQWKPALALATILCVIGLGVMLRPGQDEPETLLSPGMTKAAGEVAAISLPASGKPLRMLLELPGETSSVECSVKLSEVDAAGKWTETWSTPGLVRSAPREGGQQLKLSIEAKQLRAGDYVAQAIDKDGTPRNSYVFRVTAPR